MNQTPEIPEDFDSEEELEQYIDQLHNQIEFLENELEESEKENSELKQELGQLEKQASQGDLQEVHSKLEKFIDTMDDIELHGTPDTDSLQDSLRNPDF